MAISDLSGYNLRIPCTLLVIVSIVWPGESVMGLLVDESLVLPTPCSNVNSIYAYFIIIPVNTKVVVNVA